jgi:hypothetical protein
MPQALSNALEIVGSGRIRERIHGDWPNCITSNYPPIGMKSFYPFGAQRKEQMEEALAAQ